jgi:hypothetical protein
MAKPKGKLTVGANGVVSAEMRADVIRCSCGGDSEKIRRVHGYQANRVDLNPCPKPLNIEYGVVALRWERRDLTPYVLLIVFALGAALAYAVGQLWTLLPFVIGATLQVNGGRGIVTGRLRSVGTEPLNLGWGTGAGTTAAADTTLFTEVLVSGAAGGTDHTVGTSSQVTTSTTNDTYQVIATRTATAAFTVTNAGLFDAASGGTLYMKGDFAGVALANGDAIQFTCKVQYT